MTSDARNFGVPRQGPRFFKEDFRRHRHPRAGNGAALCAFAAAGVFVLALLSLAGAL